MADLPKDVLENIFGRLPIWAQWEVRAVCKHWKSLLSGDGIGIRRAKEPWILVPNRGKLLWFNVNQGKWVRKIPESHSATVENFRCVFRCVFGERLFFLDEKGISSWNAVTGECRVEKEKMPVAAQNQKFDVGAYADNTGRLSLYIYGLVDGATSQLFRCDPGRSWEKCEGVSVYNSDADFNLSQQNPVVPIVSFRREIGFLRLHFYDLVKRSFVSLRKGVWIPPSSFHFKYLHFQNHGDFSIELTEEDKYSLEVSRLNKQKAQGEEEEEEDELWKFTARSEDGLVKDMVSEARNSISFIHCSDGVENIWSLLPGCSRMLQYNIVSDVWTPHPSIVEDEADVKAFYTFV